MVRFWTLVCTFQLNIVPFVYVEGENRDSFEAEKLPEPAPQTAQQQGKLSPKPPAVKFGS